MSLREPVFVQCVYQGVPYFAIFLVHSTCKKIRSAISSVEELSRRFLTMNISLDQIKSRNYADALSESVDKVHGN